MGNEKAKQFKKWQCKGRSYAHCKHSVRQCRGVEHMGSTEEVRKVMCH